MSDEKENQAKSKLEGFAKQMFKEFSNEELENSQSRDDRIHNIILSYSCIGAVVSFLPPYLIPGADFWAISFIQVMMGLKIAEQYGIEAKRETLMHVLKTFGMGFGMGWLAQNAVLTAYRFILPHWGAITSFTMVFSASYVIGKVFHYYFENQDKGKTELKDAMGAVIKDAFKEGKAVAQEYKEKLNFEEMKKKVKDFFEKKDNEDDDDQNKSA